MLKWINNQSISIKGVINIGSYNGAEYTRFQKINIANMIMIEPIPGIFNESKNRIEKIRLPHEKIIFFNLAISDYDGTSKFFLSTNKDSSSLLPFQQHLKLYPKIKTKRTINVTVSRLDSLFQNHGLNIKDYNFIFMDTNGNDYEALVGAGDLLNSVNFIVAEVFKVELYKKNKTVKAVDKYLTKFGFDRVKTDWKTRKRKKTWGNALYYRAQ